MITIYYDGKCGLCSKEIDHYRSIAQAGIFDWKEVHKAQDELAAYGISLADGLRLLHAQDDQGEFHKGVDAFILIWKQLKRWRLLGFIIGLPILYPLSNIAYKAFANWRFNRLDHCKL